MLVYACIYSCSFPSGNFSFFFVWKCLRPFLKVSCICQFYLFQRANKKKTRQKKTKLDHITFEIVLFSNRMKIIISFWLIASEIIGSLLLTLAWSIDYQVERKTSFAVKWLHGKWLYEDKFVPVMYWSFCGEVCSINLTSGNTFTWLHKTRLSKTRSRKSLK